MLIQVWNYLLEIETKNMSKQSNETVRSIYQDIAWYKQNI